MDAQVIDLFCGIGGLSAGFRNEGFEVLAGIDLDGSCKFAFETNIGAKFIEADISKISASFIRRLYSSSPKLKRRILIGCAPCQPFSIYTGRYRKKSTSANDPRWQLLEEFARLVRQTRPDVITMENVPRLTLHPVFGQFVDQLRKLGYVVTYHKVRAEHYGVPQYRTRLVLFASIFGEVRLISPTHRGRVKTVRDAIGKLPKIRAGIASSRDRLHRSRNLSDKNLLRLMTTAEGGGWQDWHKSLQLKCHKKKKGESFRSVYGRMKWDEPSPVITTQCLGIGNGRFGHPEQHRAISIREAAILQSFPKSFKFLSSTDPVNGLQLSRQIGNAVPVKLAAAIARSIRFHLREVETIGKKSAVRTY
jgi:DNA (cytosine-5)-methyltransferase 1